MGFIDFSQEFFFYRSVAIFNTTLSGDALKKQFLDTRSARTLGATYYNIYPRHVGVVGGGGYILPPPRYL